MFYAIHEKTEGREGNGTIKVAKFSNVDCGIAKRTHVITFDGISEAVRVSHEAITKKSPDEARSTPRESARWLGRAFKDWQDVIQAVESVWEEGMKTVEAMIGQLRAIDLPTPATVRRRPTWRDDEPGDFNLDRCLVGQPFWRTPSVRPVCGVQTVSMLCQVNGSACVSPQQMLWRGAAMAALASILEEAGYSAEIQVYNYTQTAYRNGDDLLNTVWVKRAGEPLDLAALVNASSAWFFRTVCFGSYHVAKDVKVDYGYGLPSVAQGELLAYMAESPEAAWQIRDVWSEREAIDLCKRYLSTLAEKDDEAPAIIGGRLHNEWRP